MSNQPDPIGIRIGSDIGLRSRIQRTNERTDATERTITAGYQETAVDACARAEKKSCPGWFERCARKLARLSTGPARGTDLADEALADALAVIGSIIRPATTHDERTTR